jgi:cytochrome c oxidase subunit 2
VAEGKEGTYRGQCAELCGQDHGFMPIVVEVKTRDEFKKWVDAQKAEAKQAGVTAPGSATPAAATATAAAATPVTAAAIAPPTAQVISQ